jgi:hypothetical protein
MFVVTEGKMQVASVRSVRSSERKQKKEEGRMILLNRGEEEGSTQQAFPHGY